MPTQVLVQIEIIGHIARLSKEEQLKIRDFLVTIWGAKESKFPERYCEICKELFKPKTSRSIICNKVSCKKQRAKLYHQSYARHVPMQTLLSTYKLSLANIKPHYFFELKQAVEGNLTLFENTNKKAHCLQCGNSTHHTISPNFCCEKCRNNMITQINAAEEVVISGRIKDIGAKVFVYTRPHTKIFIKYHESLKKEFEFFNLK